MSNKIHKSISIIAKIVLAIAFAISATLVILSASGYQIELTKGGIVQTAMIVVKALPKQAVLSINGKIYEPDNLWRVPSLPAGNYTIEVSKPNYNIWTKSVYVDAGQTALYEDVILFLLKPIETAVENNSEKSKFINDLNNQKTDSALIVTNNEILLEGSLVTRFSKPIYNAKIFPDDAHITFISDNQFHIIDIDGSNDIALFDLKNDAKYLFVGSGQSVLCLEGDKLRQVRIR